MEFKFDCEEILDCDRNGFSVLEGSHQNKIIPGYKIFIKEILDKMGELSSKSQNLLFNITTTNRFFPSDHCLIIKAEKNKVLGYIKVGPKKLFLRDRICNYHERKTLCVLDFYVYDTELRKGLGREIFDFMLNYKNVSPGELAYDRPTLKFLSFLKKNYGLEDYITQENNFTIFSEFFNYEKIKNNETQYDNDTHRVIQNLTSPKNINSLNYNISDNNNSNNNKFMLDKEVLNNINDNNVRKSPNYKKNISMTETNNSQRNSMSPIGKQLIYSNDFKNKDLLKNKIGQNRYNNYNNNYSMQKINLNNDYMNNPRRIPNEYTSEQDDGIYENQINNKILHYRYNYRNTDEQRSNKRYNYEKYLDDNKISDFDYFNNMNQRSQNFINTNPQIRERYSPNQMTKSLQIYGNKFNDLNNKYDEQRKRNYEFNEFYNNKRYNNDFY